MSIPALYQKRYCFHFTHIENLDSIIKNGLLCTNEKEKLGLTHVDVAAESIQERRHDMAVTCKPKGTVHDYVPFYLCSMNPMFLSIVNSKNIDQQFFVFLAVKLNSIPEFVFTDASANTKIPPNFYNDPTDLSELDWDLIDSKKWGNPDDEARHKRMAEILIPNKVPVDLIDSIIVWNNDLKKLVKEVFKHNDVGSPSVTTSPFNGYYFHFTKFMLGLPNESLITGPYFLKRTFESTITHIIDARRNLNKEHVFLFDNIIDALSSIAENFSAIPELAGIFDLETDNKIHSENVSDHTLMVVEKLEKLIFYQNSNNTDKNILKLSAYLHDIGKGPKSKWKDGIQSAYPDHPADGPEMLQRFLINDIKNLSAYEIRNICLLVTYHDLTGEIMFKNRALQQLVDIVNNEQELEMLSAIGFADVSALNAGWRLKYALAIGSLKKKVMKKLGERL